MSIRKADADISKAGKGAERGKRFSIALARLFVSRYDGGPPLSPPAFESASIRVAGDGYPTTPSTSMCTSEIVSSCSAVDSMTPGTRQSNAAFTTDQAGPTSNTTSISMPCHITNLPDECLSNILSMVQGDDELAVRLTCRHWNSLRGSSASHITILKLPRSTREFLGFLRRRKDGLTGLTIRSSAKLSGRQLALIGERCPRLRHLDLDYQGHVGEKVLVALGSGCPELRTLKLKIFAGRCTLKGLVTIASSCPHLADVSLPPPITDEMFLAISPHLTNVHILDLSWCAKITDASFLEIPRHQIRLEDLDLSHTQITDSGMASLQTLTHLTCLRMNGIHSATSASIASLVAALPHLAALDLGQNRNMDEIVHEIAAQGSLSLKSIIIKFEASQNVGPEHFSILANGFPHLQSLNTGSYSKISCSRSTQITTPFATLHALILPCFGVSDLLLAEIARNCRSLRTVKIGAGTESRYEMARALLMTNNGGQAECLITDTGLRILADSCRHLAELHLYCPHVLGLEFDRGFEMLIGLSLSAARLSDAGMHQISLGCPKLKRLAVRRCKEISHLGVRDVLVCCPFLEHLDLSGCTHLSSPHTAESIISFGKSLRVLKPPRKWGFFGEFESRIESRGCVISRAEGEKKQTSGAQTVQERSGIQEPFSRSS